MRVCGWRWDNRHKWHCFPVVYVVVIPWLRGLYRFYCPSLRAERGSHGITVFYSLLHGCFKVPLQHVKCGNIWNRIMFSGLPQG